MYWIYAGGKKNKNTSKDISDNNNNLVLNKKLFIKAFYKYSFNNNAFYIIKRANRLIYLSLVVGIAILGL